MLSLGRSAVLLALAVMLMTAAPASADYSTWGSSGAGPGQFSQPGSISVAPNGDVLVGELAGKRVQRFTASGDYLGLLPGTQGKVLSLLATADGGAWVESFVPGTPGTGGPGLQHVSASGLVDNSADTTLGFTSPNFITGLALTPTGDLLVASVAAMGVERFVTTSRPATFVAVYQPNGSAGLGRASAFADPDNPEPTGYFGLAAGPDGTFFVADTTNARVEHFSADGSFLGEFPVPGADGHGYLGIASDRAGDLYVTTRCAVQKFSPDGALLGTAEPPSHTCGSRLGISAGAPNVVYVTGLVGENTVTRIDPSFSLSLAGTPKCVSGGTVKLTANASKPPFGSVTDYTWTADDATTDTGATPTLEIPCGAAGTKQVRVTATSSLGTTAQASVEVNVAPAPPAGTVGVTINNGDYATNDPHVLLNVVWPVGASTALVSNNGGFGTSGQTGSFPLIAQLPWTLQESGPERLPKTVYTRFLGAGADTQNFTSDIILDRTAPQLQSATLESGPTSSAASARAAKARPKLKTYRLRVKARDPLTGVCAVQASRTKAAGATVKIADCHKRGVTKLAKPIKVKLAQAPRFVRVENSAHGWSRWHKLGRAARSRGAKRR